ISIESGSNANVVEANLVGTDANDTELGNTGAGIQITGSLSNVVRGGNTVARNQTGIRIMDAVAATTAVGNRVEGNAIRTNTSHGVQIAGGGRHTIGGTAAGTANTIVSNGGSGIDIAVGATGGSLGNLVRGNFIGVDAVATAGLGNKGSGVSITGGSLNEVSSGNVIANNTANGIAISASSSNTIGGSTTAAGNSIYGNTQNGVSLAAGSSSNLVAANTISGNTQAGVSVSGAASQGNVIGARVVAGAATGLANTISNNTGGGVVVDAAVRNQIFANLISGNTANAGALTGPAAGIRLLNSGNGAAPTPVIATAAVAGRQLTLTGTIGTTAGQQFWIEVYRNGTVAPAQANQPIGRVLVTTRAGGGYTTVLTLANGTFLPSGELLTATATSTVGNTSGISAEKALS
ncbi:MAG: beta strand repeat-containing protein, partial [Planctomycetia bacterium]